MFAAKLIFIVLFPLINVTSLDLDENVPSILINVLVRNKAHTLPYFLSSLYNLNYPKSRLTLLFQADNNEDNSEEILAKWVESHNAEYNSVNISLVNTDTFISKSSEWNKERYDHVIKSRENALNVARSLSLDFLFSLDADVFFVNKDVLQLLIRKNLTLVAPMLKTDGVYSNFWCGMTEDFYYNRTEDYKPILERKDYKIGCHSVPMIHTAVLINLKKPFSDQLSYNPDKIIGYNVPTDDIIALAMSARSNNIDMYICNDEKYGYIPVPIDDDETIEMDRKRLLNVKLEAIGDSNPLELNDDLKDHVTYPAMHKFGFNKIFMINLKRRSDRRENMMKALKEIGMEVTIFDAVDGQDISPAWLKENNIHLMEEYEDPINYRPIKMGEIGCFLSHYYIWLDIINNQFEKTLILEDDIRFKSFFIEKIYHMHNELDTVEWDFTYIGRKILNSTGETYVTNNLVKPNYSYWTLGYAITLEGARKLVDSYPLKNLIPVDEFLPIMYNKHPNDTFTVHYPKRDLIALATAPVLISPTHYTGQDGYISDTEDSVIIKHIHTEL